MRRVARLGAMPGVAGLAILLSAASAVAAPLDPAPIPDEVVAAVIHGPRRQPPHPVPERLQRHLDTVVVLLQRLAGEVAGPGGSDAEDVSASGAHMLLGSTLHELRMGRDDLRDTSAGIRARLVGPGQSAAAWDELWARIEGRFDRVLGDLTAVHQSRTRGARADALRTAQTTLRALHQDVPRADAAPAPDRTLVQDVPTPREPDPVAAPPPQHMSQRRAPPRLYAFAGHTLLAEAPATPTEAQACGYTAADLGQSQEIQLTPEIRSLAASVDYAPARLYQYVANDIAFEPYYGSLKGAMGTLVSKAGNATDHASLLIALLRASNIPARYVKGTVRFSSDARLLRWVGAQDYPGAAAILAQGRIPTSPASGGVVQFTHVWVEACVPYGNYRGTGIDLTGHRWIPLDPSFKDHAYQAGIPTNVAFDYAGYLAGRTNDLPHERYALQVETFIKTQPPNYATNTLEDVGYVGRILPRALDLLPASLPYEVLQFTAWGSTGSAEAAEVPDGHRYKLEVIPENGSVPEHDLSDPTSFADFALNVPAVILSLPETILARVTLSFKGATAGDQATLDAWKANPDLSAPLPCAVTVAPAIKVDGVEQPFAGPTVGLCSMANRLTLRVVQAETSTTSPGGRPFPPLNQVIVRSVQAADYHALLAYGFQTGDRLLTERAARLLASVRSTPTPNANQDETEGEFLHLTGLKYLRYLADAFRRIGELDGGSGHSGNHLGLTSSRMKVAYVFDQPFAIYQGGYLIDVPGGLARNVDLASGQLAWKSFRLMGYTASAYESYVWQENARLDAVSSVRGLQFARETGIEVLTVTSANRAAETPKLTSNPDASYNYSSSQVTQVQALVDRGFTVTLPRRLLQYQNWKGAVWIGEKNDIASGTMSAGFVISGGYAGGYTVGAPIGVAYDPGLETGSVFETPTPVAGTVPLGTHSGNTLGVTYLTLQSGDPVNLVTGNLYHSERDLSIRGRGGLPIVFERSYNSRGATDGPLGFGWTHSFNHQLLFNDDNASGADDPADHDGLTSSVTWIDGTGSRKFIAVSGTAAGVAPGSVFIAPKGFFFQVSRSPDGTYTIREKNGLTYTFESAAGTIGQRAMLVQIADRNGNALTLAYSAGRLASVTDGIGRSLTFTPDSNGRIAEVRDWTNRRHQYTYDASGNLATYRNPLAVAGQQAPVSYAYYSDAELAHAMQSYTLPRGNGMTFEYYINGRVFRHATTLGETTTFSYNDFRRETVVVNERGYARRYVVDEHGNPLQIVEENGGTRTYTYDPANPMNRLTRTDPMGRTTAYAYDAAGNVTRVTLPSGATVESSAFDAFHQPGMLKDARGHYTLVKYDPRGNPLEVIRLKRGLGPGLVPATYVPAPGDVVAWTINTYDAVGNLLSTRRVRDAATQAGLLVTYTYDSQSLHPVSVARQGSGIADVAPLTYDALGRPTSGIRADWSRTQAAYDEVDRVTQATDPLGNLRTYTYDANGNLTHDTLTAADVADQLTYTYDGADRRTSVQTQAGALTTSAYDAAGNVVAITDPDGVTVGVEYDPSNRAIRLSDAQGHAEIR